MGGGVRSSSSFSFSSDDHSSLEDDKSHYSSHVLEFEPFEIPSGFDSEEFDSTSCQGNSSIHVPISENLRRRLAQEADIIKSYSYGDSMAGTQSLTEAKRLLLSYKPGSWIDKDQGEKLSDFDVPKATTLLVVGFKGSGKSSLINRISRVFEDEKFASDRAQVSCICCCTNPSKFHVFTDLLYYKDIFMYNMPEMCEDCSSLGDGTRFLHGYMVPRCSSSFCLFDTRGFSDETNDNDGLIESWMTNGVRNGELVIRKSDNPILKDTLIRKIRDGSAVFEPTRKVNFVIFAVDGLSVLEFMNSDKEEDTRRAETLARTYNSPYLSFGDDKPVIVVTKGDLLSHEERARVRVYLGELLGVPPKTQIFDIPESQDPTTELATLEMLKYALEHADKNLPHRSWTCEDPSSNEWSTREELSNYEKELAKELSNFEKNLVRIFSLIVLVLGIAMTSRLWCQPLSHNAPLSNSPVHHIHDHGTLVNQTVDHPAEPRINSTAQTASFCNHRRQDSKTTGETGQTVNLDPSNSSTRSSSEPTRATSTGQEQQTPVKPKQQTPVKLEQQTPQRPVKAEQQTAERPIKPEQQTPQRPAKPEQQTPQRPSKPEQQTPQGPSKPEQQTAQRLAKPEQQTAQRPVKPDQQTQVKPRIRRIVCKLRPRKQQKAEDVSDPTTNWEARKRLWLVDNDPTINWEARKRLWLVE